MKNKKQIKTEMLKLLEFIKSQRIDIINAVDERLPKIIDAYIFNRPKD